MAEGARLNSHSGSPNVVSIQVAPACRQSSTDLLIAVRISFADAIFPLKVHRFLSCQISHKIRMVRDLIPFLWLGVVLLMMVETMSGELFLPRHEPGLVTNNPSREQPWTRPPRRRGNARIGGTKTPGSACITGRNNRLSILAAAAGHCTKDNFGVATRQKSSAFLVPMHPRTYA